MRAVYNQGRLLLETLRYLHLDDSSIQLIQDFELLDMEYVFVDDLAHLMVTLLLEIWCEKPIRYCWGFQQKDSESIALDEISYILLRSIFIVVF